MHPWLYDLTLGAQNVPLSEGYRVLGGNLIFLPSPIHKPRNHKNICYRHLLWPAPIFKKCSCCCFKYSIAHITKPNLNKNDSRGPSEMADDLFSSAWQFTIPLYLFNPQGFYSYTTPSLHHRKLAGFSRICALADPYYFSYHSPQSADPYQPLIYLKVKREPISFNILIYHLRNIGRKFWCLTLGHSSVLRYKSWANYCSL